jgi:hypothetical protein
MTGNATQGNQTVLCRQYNNTSVISQQDGR